MVSAFPVTLLPSRDSHPNVRSLDDSMPDLRKIRAAGHRYNLILLSAVWMHVPVSQRQRAFRVISELLAPNGILVITLRHSSYEAENQTRGFLRVSQEEL